MIRDQLIKPLSHDDDAHSPIDVVRQAISGLAEPVIDAPHKFLLGQFLHHQGLQDGPG